MLLRKKLFFLSFLLLCGILSKAQIEVAHVSAKNFKATGFGGFLNFSFPVSEVNYITLEGGLQYFNDKSKEEDMALAPVLLGYRYTLNGSGTGLYIEPAAGYSFGATSMAKYENSSPLYDSNGKPVYVKVAGPTAGIGVGYLFEPAGRIQFNVALRYEHGFSEAKTNIIALRVSHAFTFGRRYAE